MGAAVTIKEEVIWAESVPTGTSTQQAELIALTKAPELNQGLSINFCTNNWYSLLWRIYKERELLTLEGKTIKNKDEIQALFKALWLPEKLAVTYCPGHQRRDGPIPMGNNLADKATRQVALHLCTCTDRPMDT